MPFTAELIVEPALSGVRIDTFLARQFRNYTTWRMARIVRAGGATIQGVPLQANRRVFAGERIVVQLLEPPDKLLAPEPINVPVLYEDPWIIVVDKPPGLIAHPTGTHQTGTLANGLQHHLDGRAPLPGLVRPGIVHRLDRQTSGLMVVATHHASHRALANAFENSRVAKTYTALVEGVLRQDQGVIEQPIGRAGPGHGLLMSCRADARSRKPARTRFQVLQRFPDRTLVMAMPTTGRNHQIRVHLAHLGHPLVGDQFYLPFGGHRPHTDGCTEMEDDAFRHALHASELQFAHPITGCWMKFQSPLPSDMRQLLDESASRCANSKKSC